MKGNSFPGAPLIVDSPLVYTYKLYWIDFLPLCHVKSLTEIFQGAHLA